MCLILDSCPIFGFSDVPEQWGELVSGSCETNDSFKNWDMEVDFLG